MIEVREVLRQWLEGGGKKTIARRVGVDAKTARRYIAVAEGCGLKREAGTGGLTDEVFGRVLLELEGWREREHGETWAICESRQGRIRELLEEDVRLTKIARLLGREGTEVPYSTLYRFSKEKLGFGKATPTTTLSPRPSTGSTRRRSSGAEDPGGASTRSSSPRSSGSTGSTIGGFSNPSAGFLRPSSRRPTITGSDNCLTGHHAA
jgi:hypothetical protein